MGLSNILPDTNNQSQPLPNSSDNSVNADSSKPDFGKQLGNYLQSRYPIAGGLAHAIFGNGQQTTSSSLPTTSGTQPHQMPAQLSDDYSGGYMHSQPQYTSALNSFLNLYT